MSLWLIHPRDPLIFRDGKPFTANPGERSKSLAFPYPATLAGAVRTLAGYQKGINFDDPGQSRQVEELKKITIRGPALVEMADADSIQYFFPAPADALLVEGEDKQVHRHALRPFKIIEGAKTDLDGLKLVAPSSHVKNKPYTKAPLFWSTEEMLKWLEGTTDGALLNFPGFSGPAREHRTHVSIEPGTQSSLEGALFQTSGLEFIRAYLNEEDRMKSAHSLALALETDVDLKECTDFLGGERRVIQWKKSQQVFPGCPDAIKKKIAEQRHCRVLLATPAVFDKGHLPSHLGNGFGVRVSVQGAALPRYQTISGWDYEKHTPKPTRRLVPAGSVYFLKFDETASKGDIEKFIDAVWLNPISDDEQSRSDGFGLALLGTWDGVVSAMEVNS